MSQTALFWDTLRGARRVLARDQLAAEALARDPSTWTTSEQLAVAELELAYEGETQSWGAFALYGPIGPDECSSCHGPCDVSGPWCRACLEVAGRPAPALESCIGRLGGVGGRCDQLAEEGRGQCARCDRADAAWAKAIESKYRASGKCSSRSSARLVVA